MASLPSPLPESPILRAPALIRDQVADYLRDTITSLKLPAGAPLVEREICAVTTASRATVREALRQLQSEGLVESEPGKGTFVKTFTRKEVEDMYAIRAQLEGLACRLFVRNRSTKQLEALREAVEAMAQAVDDPTVMLKEKAQFYAVLFAGADNSELTRILQGLRRRITLVQANSLAVPGRPAQSLAEIQDIVAAIEDGDGLRAEKLCVEHIQAAATTLLSSPEARFL